MLQPHRRFLCVLGLLAGLGLLSSPPGAALAAERTGERIYQEMCIRCHGANGQGVAGEYDEPLYGDRSVSALTRLIERTMPEDEPKSCTGEDAAKVAAYIHETFYSPEARARMQPAKIDFARLTVRQYQNSVADLIGGLRGGGESAVPRGGLKAQYYGTRNFREKPVIDRIDPRIEFTFRLEGGEEDPTGKEEFSIRWRGSVIADDTGEYEFVIRTENGARLWVNDDSKALIDAWVSSGGEVREHRESVFLLGGRAYPIRLDVFRFKDKTASIALQWRPPHGVLQTIPARNLSPQSVPETMVVTTAFPPDDSSTGYERGTFVSKAWDQATTNAAIEVANRVVERINALSGSRADAADRVEKVRAFCTALAERAFRRPLLAEERAFFIDAPLDGAADLESGVKRVVLLVLKSPRFLYPELGGTAPGPYAVASRLALALWDSLPDGKLLEAAAQGQLRTAEQVSQQAQRMMSDPRARSKVRDFLHHWLELEDADDISKDPSAFPDFNEEVLTDLRTSLDLFLEAVVWSESSDYRQLLLSEHLFLNDRLAAFYGIAPSENGGFEKIAFDPKERSGVLTHPYLLTILAYHRNTSPIHRGVFITRNIVGRALRPPPAAIEFMDDRFDPSLTMREKVTELTRSAACQSCHSVINPLGFSLEHFDAVGRLRTTDNNKPVDATGDFATSDGRIIRLTGARDVAEHAAASPEAHTAFIRQLFNYMVKQPVAAYGQDTLESLRRSFKASDFNIQSLLVDIARISALHGVQSSPGEEP